MTAGGRGAPGTAPTVSIVTPLYNSAPYIERTLDSLLAQTWQDWESILVDDGSVDDTRHKIQPYLEDPRFIYRAQSNAGIAAARNAGIEVARGRWICLLDHDDRWLPHKLEAQLEQTRRGEWDILCSEAVVVDGTKRYPYSSWFFPDDLIAGLERSERDPRVDMLSLLLRANFVCASSAMIDRRVFAEHGPLDRAAAPADDFDLWLRCLPEARLHYSTRPLVEYVVHGANFSLDYVRLHAATIRALRKSRSRHRGDRRRIAEFDQALAQYHRLVLDGVLAKGPSATALARARPLLGDGVGRRVLTRRLLCGVRGRLRRGSRATVPARD